MHELLVLSVNRISSSNTTRMAARWTTGTIPIVCTPLSVGAIPGHVTSVAADSADDIGGKIALLWAVELAMTDLTAILTSLVLIITESTIESGELTKLIALQLVLTFGNGCGCFNHIVDQLLGLVDLLLGICHDQAMEVLFLVTGVRRVGTALALLDGSFSTDRNLSP